MRANAIAANLGPVFIVAALVVAVLVVYRAGPDPMRHPASTTLPRDYLDKMTDAENAARKAQAEARNAEITSHDADQYVRKAHEAAKRARAGETNYASFYYSKLDCDYEGEAEDGAPKSIGVCKYRSTGVVYAGQWQTETIDDGPMPYPSGYGHEDLPGIGWYQGDFRSGGRKGSGVMLWTCYCSGHEPGESYEGQWSDDKPDGYGAHILAPNSQQELARQLGDFRRRDNKADAAVEVFRDGSKLEGIFKGGEEDDAVVRIDPSGKVVGFGHYQNGVKIPEPARRGNEK
jgi:hypothetical protein